MSELNPEDPPQMGHNRPPVDMDLLADMLEGMKPALVAGLLTAVDQEEFDAIKAELIRVSADSAVWIKAGNIEDAETSAIAADHIAQLVSLRKRIEALQKSTKKIWADLGTKAYDGYKPLLGAAERGIEKMREKQAVYLKAEQERKDAETARLREEAEALRAKQAAEAAAAEESGDLLRAAEAEAMSKDIKQAEKAAKASEKQTVSVGSASGVGRGTRLVDVKNTAVENYTTVMLRYKDRPEMHDLLDRLVAAEVRAASFNVATDKIPGVRIWITQKAQ